MGNIILIGFMGTGKTEVGKSLARQMGYEFMDTDSLIEQGAGMRISEIFSRQGEPAFRKLERELVDTLAGVNKAVISTGGGLPANDYNLPRLKGLGRLVWLTARPEVILLRLKGDGSRPLLNTSDPLGKIKSLLTLRQDYYSQADYTVDTSEISVEQVVEKIIKSLAVI